MLIGIVGKPSCGKSTFFRAATLAEAEIANYPFTTIKPNHGVGFVRIACADKDFGKQCNPRFGYCLEENRFVPVDMLDVAGLVPGAHQGLGMGNQFLDDLRQADVLMHVIDVSGSVNETGEPVEPLSYDPAKDVTFLEYELDMWYTGIIKKGWDRFSRLIVQEKQSLHKALAKQLSAFKVTEEMCDTAITRLGLNREKPTEWSEDNLYHLGTELRRRTKPMIIACNKVDVPGAMANHERLIRDFPDRIFIPCSAESELALKTAAKAGLIDYVPGNADFVIKDASKLSEKQISALEFIRTNVLARFKGTGVQQVLDRAVLELLGYIAIYPGGVGKLEDKDGNVLPDCFWMPPGSTALDFAFRLHTDFGKNFIRAIDVRTKRTVGKDHKLNHRDVVE
ncbi:redox-regulated ATPase YchF, partial [Candidatus Woesearchaeota archaeon]|nr:redox-regulated ATPase YchF [Candidatus Woesearchaeota archaeon]